MQNSNRFHTTETPFLIEDESENTPLHLTSSQSKALTSLSRLVDISRCRSIAGVTPRVKPLMHGPSGSGKTAVVRRLAHLEKLPLLSINSGSWIVTGAKAEPNTLTVINTFLRKHSSGIIFLDEIDKCVPAGEQAWQNAWCISVTSELLSLLDGDVRLTTSGWSEEDIEQLKSFIIIGAGAWQRTHGDSFEAVGDLKENFVIPEEIAFRFNSRIISISLPESKEFEQAISRLHQKLELELPHSDQLEMLAARAKSSRVGMRWVEQYLSDLLIKHPTIADKLIQLDSKKDEDSSDKLRLSATVWNDHVSSFYTFLIDSIPEISMLRAHLLQHVSDLMPEPYELNFESFPSEDELQSSFLRLQKGLLIKFARSETERSSRFSTLVSSLTPILVFIRYVLENRPSYLKQKRIFDLCATSEARLLRIEAQCQFIRHHNQ